MFCSISATLGAIAGKIRCRAATALLFLLVSLGAPAWAARPLILVSPGPLILPAVALADDASVDMELWKNQEEAIARLLAKEASAVVLPMTLGASVAGKADVVLLGVFREKLFFLLSREPTPLENLDFLKGSELLVAQGRGTVLDFLLRSVLLGRGLDPDKDLRLLYAPAPEAAMLFRQGKNSWVALPEPFATTALSSGGERTDLQDAWSAVGGRNPLLPAAGVFALREVVEGAPQDAAQIVAALSRAAAAFSEDPKRACERAASFLNVKTDALERALPHITIALETADAASADVAALLSDFRSSVSADVYGLPGPEFYYVPKTAQ